MGMAASQARYLALVARKSNCEYEGQQINQARTALSNQSANLFNQMLGLSIPIPPSTQDFTTTQYSFTDGLNASTIDSWQQLADDPEYNYVVTHHYYTNVYTGSQKKLSDPQVLFSTDIPKITEAKDYTDNIDDIQAKLVEYNSAKTDLELKEATYATQKAKANRLSSYADTSTYTNWASGSVERNKDAGTYTYSGADGVFGDPDGTDPGVSDDVVFTSYDKLVEANSANEATLDALIKKFTDNGLSEDLFDTSKLYFNADMTQLVFQEDLDATIGNDATRKSYLPIYTAANAEKIANDLDAALRARDSAQDRFDSAELALENVNMPTHVGNCELTPLANLTSDQLAEIAQVRKDMKEQGVNASIEKCFEKDPLGNEIYTGGIYSFNLNGITYYTTYYDLADSSMTGNGINNIDGQNKLTYYNADYVSTKIEETQKALLETDGNGRFVSVKLDDDSITYTLNMETITDDAAYEDAMNKYYYENALYDKTIQDINAKTSIIQQQDQQLELRLKQLDTEHNALSNEIDAVSKVVKDNVEKSFKTFGG